MFKKMPSRKITMVVSNDKYNVLNSGATNTIIKSELKISKIKIPEVTSFFGAHTNEKTKKIYH